MRRGTRLRTAGIGLAAVAAAGLMAPSPASAAGDYEWDTAVAGSPPSFRSGDCASRSGVTACFEKNGDKWWVKDTAADGHSATASWYNLLGPNLVTYRQGSCVNKLGSGKWGVCNKDYYEFNTQNPYGTGSYLYWEACVYDASDGTWHGCSSAQTIDNDG
jgi:hypothetical protein